MGLGPWKSLGNIPRQRKVLHNSSVVGSINDPNTSKPFYYHSHRLLQGEICMQRLCIPVLCCVIGNLEFHPTVTSILVTSLITGCSFY